MDNLDTEQSKPKDIKSKIFGNDMFDLSVSLILSLNGILVLLNLLYYGASRLYWFSGCYVLLLPCVVWCVAAFTKKIKQREVKIRNVFTVIMVFVIFAAWSVGETIYAKDIFGGTKTITTEFYRPYEKSIYIDQEFDGENFNGFSLKCSKKISELVREIFHFDESEKMKVSEHFSVYKSSPKIEIEYYPNTELIKEINILED